MLDKTVDVVKKDKMAKEEMIERYQHFGEVG